MLAGGRTCENDPVSDHWLEHGHEIDGSDLAPVFSSSRVLAEDAAAAPTPTWTSGWRAVVVGGGLALLATLGVVGVANAISDNLFPSMGATRPASVWQNPAPPAEPTPTVVAVPATAMTAPTTVPTGGPSTVPSTIPATTPTTAGSTTNSTTPSAKAVVSSSSSIATPVSPTTSAPDQNDDNDRVDDDSVDDDPADDDGVDDDSSDSSGSGSEPDDSDSSGSGSDASGSDGSDDD
jgi:hypothetical protein